MLTSYGLNWGFSWHGSHISRCSSQLGSTRDSTKTQVIMHHGWFSSFQCLQLTCCSTNSVGNWLIFKICQGTYVTYVELCWNVLKHHGMPRPKRKAAELGDTAMSTGALYPWRGAWGAAGKPRMHMPWHHGMWHDAGKSWWFHDVYWLRMVAASLGPSVLHAVLLFQICDSVLTSACPLVIFTQRRRDRVFPQIHISSGLFSVDHSSTGMELWVVATCRIHLRSKESVSLPERLGGRAGTEFGWQTLPVSQQIWDVKSR